MKKVSTPFKFLSKVSNESIHYAIANEHPQTIAVIVACLKPEQAAYVIDGLSPERQLAVIKRMVYIRQIELDVIKMVEEELKMPIADTKFINIGGIDNVAEVLTVIDQGTSRNILENLEQDDPDLVNEIRVVMRVNKAVQKNKESGKITVNK
jgi:flagellar motor switch protein FliG